MPRDLTVAWLGGDPPVDRAEWETIIRGCLAHYPPGDAIVEFKRDGDGWRLESATILFYGDDGTARPPLGVARKLLDALRVGGKPVG